MIFLTRDSLTSTDRCVLDQVCGVSMSTIVYKSRSYYQMVTSVSQWFEVFWRVECLHSCINE